VSVPENFTTTLTLTVTPTLDCDWVVKFCGSASAVSIIFQKERPIKLKLPTLVYNRVRGDMIEVFKISYIHDKNDVPGFPAITIDCNKNWNPEISLLVFGRVCNMYLKILP